MQPTNLDKKVGKVEWILIQLYTARIPNNFCDATKECRTHVEPLPGYNALVEMDETGYSE